MSDKSIMAIAWYQPEQWDLLREVSADTDALETTYLEWVMNCNKALDGFTAQGIEFTKIEVDVNDLIDWCKQNNKSINGDSRSQFAAYRASEMSN